MSETEWVRVPREPTDEMQHAGQRYALFRTQARSVYEAMLDAAPSAPQGVGAASTQDLDVLPPWPGLPPAWTEASVTYDEDGETATATVWREKDLRVFGRACADLALSLTAQPRTDASEPEVHGYDPTDRRESVTIRWPDGKCLGYVLDRTRYTDNLPPSAPVVDDPEGSLRWLDRRIADMGDEDKTAELYLHYVNLRSMVRPSAPVGVEDETLALIVERAFKAGASAALAQQPAAVPFVCTGDEIRCHDGNGCECAMQGKQPAAVDEAHVGFCEGHCSRCDEHLAGQQQENGNG